MAVGYHLVLDNQPPGAEPPLSGKALALQASELEELWKEAGLPEGGGLHVFVGKRMNDHIHKIIAENLPQLSDTFGKEMKLPGNETKWFRPELGIEMVDVLMTLVRKKPDAVPDADAVIADLKNYRLVLGMAKKEGARWHLLPVDPDGDKLDAGMAYRNGEYEKAIHLYTRVLGYTHPEAYYDRAYMLTERGDCWSGLGERDTAIADYDAALGLQPDYHYALINRGTTRNARGDHERAIADFDAAAKLQPEDPVIPYYRAMAWNAKQDHDRALADLDAAIRLQPEYGDAYGNRGRTHFFKGEFKKAAADLARSQELGPDAYQAIWLYLARGRDGARNPKSELAVQAEALGSEDWPFPLLALFLGKATPESVMAGPARSEACFYVAQWYLLRKETERARALLRQVALSETTMNEHAGALAELRRLG